MTQNRQVIRQQYCLISGPAERQGLPTNEALRNIDSLTTQSGQEEAAIEGKSRNLLRNT